PRPPPLRTRRPARPRLARPRLLPRGAGLRPGRRLLRQERRHDPRGHRSRRVRRGGGDAHALPGRRSRRPALDPPPRAARLRPRTPDPPRRLPRPHHTAGYWHFWPRFLTVHLDLGDFPFVPSGRYFGLSGR